MMEWEIIVSPRAEEDISKLDNSISERIKNKLIEMKTQANSGVDPDHYLKWINKYNTHRLRIGDYRAFVDVDKENKRINVITIVKRDKAYEGWG